jgi:S-formylglutathione hydrolase
MELMSHKYLLLKALIAAVIVSAAGGGEASEYIEARLETNLMPGPVEYSVLLPDGYGPRAEPFPLLLLLHGGGGSAAQLQRMQPRLDKLWQDGDLPKMVIASPTVPTGRIYMDFKNGEEKQESFIVDQFLNHVRDNYNVSKDRRKTMISGISMGGVGSLRIAFKYPEKFGAVAAMEAAMEPGLTYDDVRPQHRWRGKEVLDRIYGPPFDPEFWTKNNPSAIAVANSAQIRSLDLAIYIECGDEDGYGFHEAAEFLHRTLWDNKIPHEYRLVRWADHVGQSINERSENRFGFLQRYLTPVTDDPAVKRFRAGMSEGQRRRGFEPHPFWPNEPESTR